MPRRTHPANRRAAIREAEADAKLMEARAKKLGVILDIEPVENINDMLPFGHPDTMPKESK